MNEYSINVKLSELNQSILEIRKDLSVLKSTIEPVEDLWDSSDLVRHWHVSERTLADWRKKKMIGYVQIHKKIYYPKPERDKFLTANSREGGANE